RAARRLVRELAPATVADLDDATRAKRLAVAVADAGWLELRSDGGGGEPLASGVETAIVADALGGAVADVAFAGPVLAADLARRAGCEAAGGDGGTVVAFDRALTAPAVVAGPATASELFAVDAGDDATAALVLVPDGSGHRLAQVPLARAEPSVEGRGTDLTRAVQNVPPGTAVHRVPGGRPLGADDLAAFTALGLALTSADLVGVMRGVLDLTVAYAAERRQYGVPIGSFQAVQHLLAEAHCLMEGS